MNLNIRSLITGLAIGVAIATPTTILAKDKVEAVRLSRRNEFKSMVTEWEEENAKVCEHSNLDDIYADPYYNFTRTIHFGEKGMTPRPHCDEEYHYTLVDFHEEQGLLGQKFWAKCLGHSVKKVSKKQNN